jgi:hypothetical protein
MEPGSRKPRNADHERLLGEGNGRRRESNRLAVETVLTAEPARHGRTIPKDDPAGRVQEPDGHPVLA